MVYRRPQTAVEYKCRANYCCPRRFRITPVVKNQLSQATHEWRLVAGKSVLRRQFPELHFDEFQQLGFIDEIALIHKNDKSRHTNLLDQQHVFASLRGRTVRCQRCQSATTTGPAALTSVLTPSSYALKFSRKSVASRDAVRSYSAVSF